METSNWDKSSAAFGISILKAREKETLTSQVFVSLSDFRLFACEQAAGKSAYYQRLGECAYRRFRLLVSFIKAGFTVWALALMDLGRDVSV